MRTKRLIPPAIALAAVLAAHAQTVGDPTLHAENIITAGTLSQPTTMAFIGSNDILVLQKANGQVRRVIGGVVQAGSVLDVAVSNDSERGLLGIALDPDFINNNFVYLYYTESTTDGGTPLGNRVYRYTWNGSALVSPFLVLDLPGGPGPNHDGGIVMFGADDKLHAIIGDLNRNGKLQNYPTGLDPDDSGVILRVNTDGSGPPDNPFFDPDTDPDNPDPMNRYLAYGVRNSFGMTFDPVTGDVWDTENGPGSYDEINRVPPGFNSGWERVMGPESRNPGHGAFWVAPGSSYSDPEFSWAVPVAPTAIAFVGSRRLGCALVNDLIVGDNNCGQLYHFELTPNREALVLGGVLADLVADNTAALRCSLEQGDILFGSGFGVITDAKNGPDGRLYLVSLTQGRIYRIVRTAGTVVDADADEVEDSCDCDPSNATAWAVPSEVPLVRLSGNGPTNLGWDPQSGQAGTGTTYTVVTGDVADLRPDGGFASACTLQTGLTTPRLTDIRPNPIDGQAYYYLVRASNACGDGTFGDGSGSPDPRDLLDAALPANCP